MSSSSPLAPLTALESLPVSPQAGLSAPGVIRRMVRIPHTIRARALVVSAGPDYILDPAALASLVASVPPSRVSLSR